MPIRPTSAFLLLGTYLLRLIALAAASMVFWTSIERASAQTPVSVPFANFCDMVTIGPDTIMSNPTGGSGTVTLTPGVPNDASGVSFVNVQSQIVLIWYPGAPDRGPFRGTLTCHPVISGHPIDITRSVFIDVGGALAHEWHNYTFGPINVAFPLVGGTLTITDPERTYELVFAAGTGAIPLPRIFPAEAATLLLIAPSSAMPIPTLVPLSLCALGVVVAMLGIFALRQERVAWIHPDQAKPRRAIPVPLNHDAVLFASAWGSIRCRCSVITGSASRRSA